MRHLVFFLAFFIIGKIALSQDTITKINGTKSIVLVQEIGVDEIKYKHDATGPVYIMPKNQVGAINFADGTKIVINAPAPPPPPKLNDYQTPPTEYYPPRENQPPVQNHPYVENRPQPQRPANTSSDRGAYYFYFGFRSSLSNSYNGGDLNNYWDGLFSDESAYAASNPGYGSVQLNQGFSKFNGLFIGHSFPLSDREHLNFELQVDFSATHALRNSASFADTSGGSIYFNLTTVNFAGQYMRGVGNNDRLQVGGEVGIDIGSLNGYESEYLYPNNQPLTYYFGSYKGTGLGGHVAAVGKLFLDKRKALGLELRAGYRYLQTQAYTTSDSNFDQTVNIDWSGAFVTAGAVIQINSRGRRGYGY